MKEGRAENRNSFLERLGLKVAKKDIALIDVAYVQAKYGHRNQKRDSGERYFEHLRSVALILMDELNIFEPRMIIAALLHDILEDSHLFTRKSLAFIFGKKLAKMVFTLSVPPVGVVFSTKEKALEQYHLRIKSASIKVIIIKLCDRLHNLRTLNNCSPEKIERKLKETKKHYLPLIGKIRDKYPLVADIFDVQFKLAIKNLETS
jgi:guanosine-3',5'-bis(diphosphate) 3'-pyrophosphohydrolase